MTQLQVLTFESGNDAARDAADRFAREASTGTLASAPEWHVAVSGGSVAETVVPEIVRAGQSARIDWSRLHVWFADERYANRGSVDRNATPIIAALRDASGFDPQHLHVPLARDESDSLEAAVGAYAEEIRRMVRPRNERPSLDLVLLGMGPDGHTASLFPGRVGHENESRDVIAVDDSPKPPSERVTLTLPVLCAAERVWTFAFGESKSEAVATALERPTPTAERSPIGAVRGRSETVFFLDRDAAGER